MSAPAKNVSAPIPGLAELEAAEAAAGGPAPSTVYGESMVDVDVSGKRTPDEVVEEGRAIFDKVRRARAAGLDPDDTDRMRCLEADLRKAHPEFSQQFPVPFRWMVHAGDFAPEIFRGWLVSTQTKKMWDTRADWLESQATYLTRLYRHRHPRAGGKEISDFTQKTVAALRQEEADHKEIVEEVQDEMEATKASALVDLRARLKDCCAGPGAERSLARLRWAKANAYEGLQKGTVPSTFYTAAPPSSTSAAPSPPAALSPPAAPSPPSTTPPSAGDAGDE